jgi:hypothetical protein
MKYLERFEYFCKECGQKGTVIDVLLNPDVLLIRGLCPACNKSGTYKVIDIEALRQEHDAITLEEAANILASERTTATKQRSRRVKLEEEKTDASIAKAQKKAEVVWKWHLQSRTDKQKDKE